jgi:hypothetical protein
MEKHLHVISFDVPYPANYGGVIDVYYKIKALHKQGVKIHLHCFEYGRPEAPELEKICEKVYYYKRHMSKALLLNKLPFMVVTRSSERLMEILLQDNHPILFEGLHSCFHLDDIRLKNRLKIVRTHNIEHDYYKNLEKVERSFFRKTYFRMEAKKLKDFEKILNNANHIIAISPSDTKHLSKHYNNVNYVAAFHANEKIEIKEGNGKFCLYHGNLEVGENNEAALFLVNEVFSRTKTPLIIAGKKPSKDLITAVAKYNNIEIKANISTEEIDTLISDAQINVLPTFQSTGIKLKLLAALFRGRYCVVNSPMVENTGLEDLCLIQNNPELMAMEIKTLFKKPFDMLEKKKREILLSESFSNESNAKKLLKFL